MTDSNLVANAVVASANSQFISIVPENGEQFNPGQKIIYNIEPEIGFIKKDSYLVFDILNNSGDNSRLTLYKNLGAHAIIDRVDIFSKETGVLLESNTHYAQWCNIENQYLYDSTNNLSNHQGVGAPVQSWTHQLADNNTETNSRSLAGAHDIENNQLSPCLNGNDTAAAYVPRRYCIPLMVGLFGAYDSSEKAIPIMPFGGLRIEITLAQPKMALQDLAWRKKNTLIRQSSGADELLDWKVAQDITDDGTDQSAGANLSITFTAAADTGFSKSLQDMALAVGNRIRVVGKNTADADVDITGTINQIRGAGDRELIINGRAQNYHTTLTLRLTIPNNTGPEGIKDATAVKLTNEANYKVMSTEFRLLTVVPPPNVMDGLTKGLNYEFTSYEVFFDNVPSAALRHQVPIHSVASKALATFTMLYDTENDEGQIASAIDFYGGSLPDSADVNLDEVVYFINNRLYPLRAYKPGTKKDKVLAQNELVKSWRAIGKEPMNLGSADYGDLQNYSNTPLISRELARNGMVFDLRNAEPELRLTFTAARPRILRANTYVFSKKIVQTTATGVQVIH